MNFAASQNADLLIGAPAGGWTTRTSHSTAAMANGLRFPNGVAVDASGSVYVSDSRNHRLMRWGATPAGNYAAMTNVLMKADASQASWGLACLNGSTSPEQMTVVGDGATTRLAVADRYNHRVVLFTSEPTADGTTGTVFLGQAGGGACGANRGTGTPTASTLDSPSAVWTDGSRVAVADTNNHRVLLWDSWPSTGQAADRVLGQADFASNLPNRGASVSATTLSAPKGVWFDGTWLYVADSNNHRVLAWNGWPAASGASATNVLGQADMVSSNSTCSSRGLTYPTSVTSTGSGAGHRLVIAAENQHRVVVHNGWPSAPTNNTAISSALGQTGLASCAHNANQASATAATLRAPGAVTFDGSGNLWVADVENHRVLRFPSLATGASADRVLGQPNFTSNIAFGVANANTFEQTTGASSAGPRGTRVEVGPAGQLVVSNVKDQSIQVWSSAPTSDNEPFTYRFGQTARDRTGNNGPPNDLAAATLNDPIASWTDGTRLLVADQTNDRVLVWTAMPTSDTDAPDYVIGQPNFTSNEAETTQAGLDKPSGVASDGVDIFVADRENHRVLVYRNFWLTPSNGTPADVVLGQSDFTSGSAGGGATRLSDPYGVAVDSRRRLVVADQNHNRLLVWNDHATVTDGQAADAVIGQASFTAYGAGTISEDVVDVEFAGGGIVWAADGEVRYLDPLPTSGAVTTSSGQVGLGNASQTVGQNRIDTPTGVGAASGKVWVANTEHARLMRWTDTTAPTITVAPVATVRCDGTVSVTWSTSESTTTEIRWDTVSRASWAGGYANSAADLQYTGLVHTHELSFATPGTKYVRVRGTDWNSQSVDSGEISFTVPSTCPAPTTMLADDTNAQAGTGRANPSTTSTPPISSTAFHSSWTNVSGVTMDRVDAQAWSTPPEHAGGVWHMDGSTAADANGQSTNAITWTGAQPYTTGRFGQAATFTADGRQGAIADNAALRKSNDFTFDLWFNATTIANADYPIMAIKSDVDCDVGYRCNYSLEFDRVANQICAYVVSTAPALRGACGSASGLVATGWHHAALTVTSSNQLRLYVDGQLAAGPTAIGAPVRTGADPITIGRGGSTINHFRGSIDEVRFSPTAYDAGAILGYYRTRRPHLDQLWSQGSTALGANCSTTTRCEDQAYAGTASFIRPGARYWMRTRFNTLNNDYWTDRGVDWFGTTDTSSINISVGGTVAFGSTLPGQDAWGTSQVEVTTNAAGGYQLLARDESDAWGLERLGGGAQPTVPDRQDGAVAPAPWTAGTAGFFGVTVRSATGTRLAKWGTAPGGFPESDVANNLYTGLEGTSDVLLHERTTYGAATDTVLVTWRANPGLGQAAGSYDGVMTLTAVANP